MSYMLDGPGVKLGCWAQEPKVLPKETISLATCPKHLCAGCNRTIRHDSSTRSPQRPQLSQRIALTTISGIAKRTQQQQ